MPVTPRPPKIIPSCIGWEIHSISPFGSTTGVFLTGTALAGVPDPTEIDCQNVCNSIHTWLFAAASLLGVTAPDSTFDYIRAWSLAVLGGPEFTVPAVLAGIGAANSESFALAAQIIENTNQHRRNAFGRIYYGPLAKGVIDPTTGLITPGALAVFLASFENLGIQLGGDGYPWVVGSGVHGTHYPITGITVPQVVAIQSRRGRGRD
jgi:hypothetical protein